ncbi:MAG TPA: putative toxin-antitoxin system toxin component, PIN family [Verrucomicrobiae bacterium]|nr:putative toxin-antitoxin system toxin component, PIN family [Verrucomicrobiae bacterium]
MITAVFDSNVIISGLVWRGESHLCLIAQARRYVRAYASEWIIEEVRRTIKELEASKRIPRDPWPGFNWFSHTAKIVDPALLGKRRSRDANDDPILGTALGARVTTVVTKDRDLLALGKPFGVEIVHPRDFLRRLIR